MDKVYVYPKLSAICGLGIRFGGPGLGNCLFIVSRAYLIAQQYQYELIDPDWISIKLGPFFRKERDKRLYINFFKTTGINGVRKLLISLFASKLKEEVLPENCVKSNSVIYVTGLKNYFEDLKYHREYISHRIISSIQLSNFKEINNFDGNCIGVHIRTGDYKPEWRVPIEWFIIIIEKIRKHLQADIKVCVFSDGTNEELKEVLKINNVQKVNLSNAITELVCLSKCKLILASNSTFSAWAIFLGNKPSIWMKRYKKLENILPNKNIFQDIVLENDELPELLKLNLRELTCE
jgi:hypothetical protein